jgi:hypothetical protein
VNLPNTPAIARLSTIIGVEVPSRIRDLVSPFALTLPATADVTATPGSPPTYLITSDEKHIRIASGADEAPVLITLPDPSGCVSGTMFSILVHKEAGGSNYAVLTDGTILMYLPVHADRYQFIVANGQSLSMLNDWKLWGNAFSSILTNLGNPGEGVWGVDATAWVYIEKLIEGLTDVQTITLSGVIADDVMCVLGEVLTAVESAPGDGEFLVGLSDSETATNLAALIAGIDGVTASAQGEVVTVTADVPARPVVIFSGGASMVLASADEGNLMGAFHWLLNAVSEG